MQRKFQCFEHGFTFKKTTTRFYGILTVLTFSFFVMSWKPLPSVNEKLVNTQGYTAKVFASQDLTISYDLPKFKSGQSGLSKPTVSIAGGTFSYKRVDVDTQGGLSLNTVNGWISHINSDRGTYTVTYSYNSKSISTTVVVE